MEGHVSKWIIWNGNSMCRERIIQIYSPHTHHIILYYIRFICTRIKSIKANTNYIKTQSTSTNFWINRIVIYNFSIAKIRVVIHLPHLSLSLSRGFIIFYFSFLNYNIPIQLNIAFIIKKKVIKKTCHNIGTKNVTTHQIQTIVSIQKKKKVL